jgi:formyltetrahydrofolate synthetase
MKVAMATPHLLGVQIILMGRGGTYNRSTKDVMQCIAWPAMAPSFGILSIVAGGDG